MGKHLTSISVSMHEPGLEDADHLAWKHYTEAATALTRLYQHRQIEKRSGYVEGYEAALGATFQWLTKHAATDSSQTVSISSIAQFLREQQVKARNSQLNPSMQPEDICSA